MKLFEWIEGIGTAAKDFVYEVVDNITTTIAGQAVQHFKTEIAMQSLNPEMFQDKDIKKKITELKENWKHSPESISDIGNDILNIVKGKVAQVQFEAIAGVKLNSGDVISNRLFGQMGLMTDITLLASMLEVVGACIPTLQTQHVGIVLKDYLNYSGLTQATGFGYGMMLSNVVSPMITQELNQKMKTTIVAPDEAIRLNFRGLVSDDVRNTMIAKAGMSDSLRDAMIEGQKYFPIPQDFIRFAVRDTFNDEVVQKYHYDDDYPSAIDAYVKKAGMSPEWLKHFWRAHWELPSPTQTFEMLHRGKITMDDARKLLKIADLAPYFVEPMLAIAYTPYTRVDIRRMYNEGVLTKEEVLRSYKDIGYDEVHAQKLTEWTTKDGMSRERDLTLTQIIDAYTYGEIVESAAITELKKLGYDDNESKLVLKLENDKIDRALRKREKNIAVKRYVKGIITMQEFSATLDTLKISDREKKITIAEAQLQVKENVGV